MNWQQWVLATVFILNTVVVVYQTGKPRPPITPSAAAAVVVVNFLFVWMVVSI